MTLPELIIFLLVTAAAGASIGGVAGLLIGSFAIGAVLGALLGPVAAGCIITAIVFFCDLRDKSKDKKETEHQNPSDS